MNTDAIPCAFKKDVELRASEDLRWVSEQCPLVSGVRSAKSLEAFNTVLQDNSEDLSSLMHKMLVVEKDNTRSSTSKTPLSSWQACFSAKQHQGGYQLESEEDLLASKRTVTCGKNSHIFTPPSCHRNLNLAKENVGENSCVERDIAKNTRAKSASYVDDSNRHTQDGGKLTRNTRSASSSVHAEFKFYHSQYTDFYIRSYRQQITNVNIRKHIQWRLKENNPKSHSVKKAPPQSGTPTVKSKVIPKSSFTFYRFRIPKNNNSFDSAYLKVGPCPSVKTNNTASQSGKGKTQTNMAPSAVEKKVDHGQKRREIKSVLTAQKFQNTLPPQRENTVLGVDGKGNATKTESSEGQLKTIQLRVHNSSFDHCDSPRIVPKTGRASKTKARFPGVFTKPMLQYISKSSSDMSRLTRKPTFGEKEFLRITTPKPINRYQSQTPSDFDESPLFSPDKSVEISPARSPVPRMSGTSLPSQVIAEILMRREPQVVFPKNSNFQACITPSNYSTSSVETQIRNRKDMSPIIDHGQDLTENKTQSESHVQRMPSKPSIPTIGPFISG